MFDLLVFFGLIVFGYTAGTVVEKRHYRSLRARERALLDLPALTMKDAGYSPAQIISAKLVCGSAAISIDYFKRFLAGLRNIFGGRVKAYESLLDRARREAQVRMKERARGASVIVNVRLETSAIGKTAGDKGIGCVEVLAYGTALTLKDEVHTARS